MEAASSTTPAMETQALQVATEPTQTVTRRGTRSRHPPTRMQPSLPRTNQPKKRRNTRKSPQGPHTWRVAYIKDRKVTITGTLLYRVLWRAQKHGRLPRTWEPRAMLLEDGFEDAINVVDEWVEGGRQRDFFQFVSELYPSVAGANPMGTCMFLALQHALILVGEPFGVRNSHVHDFLSRATELRQDLSRGVSWKIFRAFVLQLHVAGSRLSLDEFEFNRHRTGHRGVSAIVRLSLEDGVYVVAASNTLAVGHAFVLRVRKAQRTVFDDTAQRPLDVYGEWIDRVMFVRKVTLLD
ncbi:hypothetical protein GN244_ATG13211 [Phytophthora infestans]|uniref:Uncharacterized protein n=1 Tax=Phytophthora infestans TaxID=4787 RepID=A0A833SI44_PHYIN|nr:hypothetical protein GN244_ATG13211 [Phytophthora infestans]